METARRLESQRLTLSKRNLRLVEGEKRPLLSGRILSLLLVIICLSILFNVIQRTSVIENSMKEDNLIKTLQEEKLYKEKLMAEIAQLRSPERIEEIATIKLGMVIPTQVNYVKLSTNKGKTGELAMREKENPTVR